MRERGQERVLQPVRLPERALGRPPLGHLGSERFVQRLERIRPFGDTLFQLVANAAELRRATRRLHGVPDRALETSRVEAVLREEVRGAALHRLDVERTIGGADDDHGRAIPRFAIGAQEVETASLAEPAIHEMGVEPPGDHRVERGVERPGPFDLDEARPLGHEAAEPGTFLLLVADEEDAEGPRLFRARHCERSV